MYITTETLHDLMVSKASGKSCFQYRFLLMYFIPSLTQKDLLSLLHRLPKKEKDLLFLPGGIAKIMMSHPILRFLLPPTYINNVHKNVKVGLLESHSASNIDVIEQISLRHTLVSIYSRICSFIKFREYKSSAVDNCKLHYPTNFRDSNNNLFLKALQNVLKKKPIQGLKIKNNISSNQFICHGLSSKYNNIYRFNSIEYSRITGKGLNINKPISKYKICPYLPSIGNIFWLKEKKKIMENILYKCSTFSLRSMQPKQTPLLYLTKINNDVLSDALSMMWSNYTKIASRSFLGASLTVIDYFSPLIIKLGLIVSSLSGIGLLAYFGQNFLLSKSHNNHLYHISSLSSPRVNSGFSITLFSSMFFGFSSAGVIYYFRRLLKYSYFKARNDLNNVDFKPHDRL